MRDVPITGQKPFSQPAAALIQQSGQAMMVSLSSLRSGCLLARAPQLCDVIVPPMIIGGSRSIRCSNDVSTIDHKCHDDVHQCRSIIPAKSVAVITEGPSVCSCLNLLHN
jgi:hypothetical protein